MEELVERKPTLSIIYSDDERSAVPITVNIYRLTTTKISTFHLRIDKVQRRNNDIDDWISFVIELKPDNISIRFIGSDHDYRFIMNDFFNIGWLKQLIVQHPDMKLIPKYVPWKSLKILSLKCSYIRQEHMLIFSSVVHF